MSEKCCAELVNLPGRRCTRKSTVETVVDGVAKHWCHMHDPSREAERREHWKRVTLDRAVAGNRKATLQLLQRRLVGAVMNCNHPLPPEITVHVKALRDFQAEGKS